MVDTAGNFDVPQEVLDRWAKVILAYDDVLAEMEVHLNTLVVDAGARFLQKQQEQETEAQKIADEAFGNQPSGLQP